MVTALGVEPLSGTAGAVQRRGRFPSAELPLQLRQCVRLRRGVHASVSADRIGGVETEAEGSVFHGGEVSLCSILH